jgi:hypothetical protein
MFLSWFKNKKNTQTEPFLPSPEATPIFDLTDIYHKFYKADGKKESLTLNSKEVSELFDYLEYVSYLDNIARCRKKKY